MWVVALLGVLGWLDRRFGVSGMSARIVVLISVTFMLLQRILRRSNLRLWDIWTVSWVLSLKLEVKVGVVHDRWNLGWNWVRIKEQSVCGLCWGHEASRESLEPDDCWYNRKENSDWKMTYVPYADTITQLQVACQSRDIVKPHAMLWAYAITVHKQAESIT